MPKFVVSYISFHDNNLTQEIVFADSAVSAIKQKLGETLFGDECTVDELKNFAFDCDSMVAAIEI